MLDFKVITESGKKFLAPALPFLDMYWKPLAIAVIVIAVFLFLIN